MNTRIPRLVLAATSLRAESISEASVPELDAPDRHSDLSAFGRLRQRLKTDEQLARDLQSGIADALTELFRRHAGLMFHVARRILGCDAEAEDVVQQIFLDVFRSIEQFNPDKGSFKTWLFMFAYHRAFNHRRSLISGRLFFSCPLDETLSIAASAQSQAELRLLVDQALSKLPARERRTIVLIYFRGLTAAETAALTQETVRVVRHNLYRGLEKLRKIVGEHGPREKTRKGVSQ